MRRHQHSFVQQVLFGLLGLLSIALLACSIGAYRGLVHRMDTMEQARTGVLYLTNVLRNTQGTAQITIVDSQTIRIEEIDQWRYIYYADGAILESIQSTDTPLEKSWGEKIVSTSSLSFTQEDSLLNYEIGIEDRTYRGVIFLEIGGGLK